MLVSLIDVHLTGGRPLWQELLGPALLAVTAIIAAWIAAKTANERQAAQLAHDRDLHQAQLAHDRELQIAQLFYDREQRNRQHVRDTIDSAVRTMYAAMKQSAEYQSLILTGDEKRDEYRRIADDEAAQDVDRDAALRGYEEAMDAVGAATLKGFEVSTELMSEGLRLNLRLGVMHPICESHTAYQEAYGASFEILRNLPTIKMTNEDREKVEAADAVEGAATVEFLSSCRRWFEGEQRAVGGQGSSG